MTIAQEVAAKKVKFTDFDAEEERFEQPAYEWLRSIAGADGYLLAMQKALKTAPRKRLSLAQLRGVLNCWRYELRQTHPQPTGLGSAPIPSAKRVELGNRVETGTFTVVFGDDQPHLTLKIYRPQAPGSPLIIGYLYGPCNESNYRWFGNIDGDLLNVWSVDTDSRVVEGVRVLAGNPLKAMKAYGIASGRCGKCGRKLTVPESILSGIGPTCLGKM